MRPPATLVVRDVRLLDDPAAPPWALVCHDGLISWSGPQDRLPYTDGIVVDGGGAMLLPAFIDAHVHTTATGLVLTGLDLTEVTSAADLLDRVAAASHPGTVLLGHGWDESRWPVVRRPTLAELVRATGGSPAYLSRTDLHSALATPDLLEGVEHDDGWVRLAGHHTVRSRAMAAVRPTQAEAAQRATRAEAARLGIGWLHEMSGPEVASAEDLKSLLALARAEPGPGVTAYWGALGDLDTAEALGAQPGGDLFVDGSFGSHTAALHDPYADAATSGALRYDAGQVEEHVHAATGRGMQAGFHCIGDLAIDTVLEGIERVAARLGVERVRAARHRLEHLELLDETAVGRVAALGLVASVQPAFDARWAGQMYPSRLGRARAARTNPFAGLAAAGVVLAFGSDAPVTPLAPWAAVRAAATAQHPVPARAALTAHTVGGAVAGLDVRRGSGTLQVGAPARLALWTGPVGAGDDWLAAVVDGTDPVCRATVVDGRVIAEYPE